MQRSIFSVHTRLNLLIATLVLFLSANAASAQNKVVVIPMAGDDVIVEVPAELTPTTPIANVVTSQADYIINAVTVIDNITKLEWQRMDDGTGRNWDDAWDYCADLPLDNHDDWRLPSITELQSIVDYGSPSAPLINQVAFTNTINGGYWSAFTRADTSSRAWPVNFNNGIIASLDKTSVFTVRCVR